MLFGRQIAPTDAALALAGVLGVLAYVLLLPGLHPDGAARYAFSEHEAEQKARAFLAERGFPTEGLERDEVRFERDSDLLTSLQQAMGRRRAIRLLKDSSAAWPAYRWEVDLERDKDDDEDDTFDLSLTQDGAVYGFTHTSFLSTRDAPLSGAPQASAFMQRHLDREALAAALGDAESEHQPLTSVPDSLLARFLTFEFSEGDSLEASKNKQKADSIVAAQRRRSGRAPRVFRVPDLTRADAAALARFHLRKAPLGAPSSGGATLRTDSVWTPPEARGRAATVRFAGTRHGQAVRADVEVYATGGLRALDVSFNPEQDDGGPEGVNLALVIAGIALMVILLIGLLVAFFRRLSNRLIDVRAGIVDAVVIGLTVAAMALLSVDSFNSGSESTLQVIGIVALVGLFTFGFTALLAFPFAAAADSVGRSAFSEKVLTMSMVRRLALGNRHVGAALLRGGALAAVLLGLPVLVLLAMPQAVVSPGDGFMFAEARQLLAFSATLGSFLSYGAVLFVLLGLGAFLRRQTGAWWPVVVGAAVSFALFRLDYISLAPVGYELLGGALIGAVVGLAFVRYDALTVFAGLFLAYTADALQEGWLVAASPAQGDLLLGLLLLGALLGLGFVGLRSGATGREAEDYTPSYIKELAEQERLQRDIEIAQKVQRDFLPRRMPQVEGLDVAALCLPAREVGGDYYDFIELDENRLAVVVGDVSGKGIEASFYMTLAKGFLQTLATEERPPAEVLRRLNTLFCRNAPRGTFITMVYGIADAAAGTFRFARAGHNPPIYRRAAISGTATNGTAGENGDGDARLLRPGGLAIGLTDGPGFDAALEEVTLSLDAGDALVLYTDGFPEARDGGGAEFGDERLLERVRQHGGDSARALMQSVADDVHVFVEAAGRHDDMTMVVLKRTGLGEGARENGGKGEQKRRRVEET